MTRFQEQYAIGTPISGTFSKLPFTGIVVAHIAECVVVQVENPHRNLPLGSRGLCFHPNDSNVTIDEQDPIPEKPQAYPTLEAYKDGAIASMWEQEQRDLIANNSSVSPVRAGELAAAKLALMAGKEYEQVEQRIRKLDFRCLFSGEDERAVDLYDWLAFNDYAIKRELIDLSGTRTLLADMEISA